MENSNGIEVHFLSQGGKLCSIKIPSENKKIDILIGYDTEKEFLNGDPFFGALIGRYANRIANGVFYIDGKKYQLPVNHATNHLHGGDSGFHKKDWKVEKVDTPGYNSSYKLSLQSVDREEGYPGNLFVSVLYALNDNNEFLIDFNAITDQPTVVNLTSHPYFNLNGPGKENINNHSLQIIADHYTPLNKNFIPTGELKNVSRTAFDLRKPVNIKSLVLSDDPDIMLRNGLDHNWMIRRKDHDLVKAAVLSVPGSKRKVEVFTTQPGIQVYAGMHFDGSETGKDGFPIESCYGLALEPQNFPDAPNKINFPNAILYQGEEYHEQIVYRFGF
ncbi:MAG: galactose mutarotase [Bacteroidales bacterium]|nr:galactose mutarotase [Bacteroidales bacterium]